MNRSFSRFVLMFVGATAITITLAAPKASLAAKDLRYSGRQCTYSRETDAFGNQTGNWNFTCPWEDWSDFRASEIGVLNIELNPGQQGTAKACLDYWNVPGGSCGAAMGNTKTLQPLLDVWGPDNLGHFKYLAGVLNATNGAAPTVKGIFAFAP